MKRKILSIAKRLGVDVLKFKSERSDMGCQMYNLVVRNKNGEEEIYTNEYWPGCDSMHILTDFENQFKANNHEPNS